MIMRRWILPLVLLVVAGVAAWQAVETDDELAEETVAEPGPSAPALRTPLLSVRRTPEYLRAPVLLTNLQQSLDGLTDAFPSQSCLVVSQDGEELFAENPTLPLVPASAQKLLTAYGAYELLGPTSTLETRLVTDVPVVDGVLDGNLWLIGGGDPLPATEGYIARYEPPHLFTDLTPLADAVVAAGITEITGAIIGDETRYDTERYVSSWPERFTDADQNQTGPLSALTINDAFVRFDPENPSNALSRAAPQPAQFAAALFDDLLEAREIVIRQSASAGEAPPGAREVATLVSDPLAAVTNQMVEISDNQAAELLLKEIGVAAAGNGSTLAGSIALEALIRDKGFTIAETDVVDGSGLASDNRVTCRLLVEILEDSAGSGLHDGLAIAGESGTLRDRLVGTAAEGLVAAKTGRLNEVGALAGTAQALDGSTLTFAWIGNTTDFYPIDEMVAVQDRLAIELVEYPQGPTIEALAPIG